MSIKLHFYATIHENSFYTWGFFLGGVNEVLFATWQISSHVGVQIGRELVRLITVISLIKFLTKITSAMSLEKFSRKTFR